MFKLSLGDFGRGLIVAILSPVVVAITAVLSTIIVSGFDVFGVDWTSLGKSLINVSIIAAYGGLVGYLGKNFFTGENGKLFTNK